MDQSGRWLNNTLRNLSYTLVFHPKCMRYLAGLFVHPFLFIPVARPVSKLNASFARSIFIFFFARAKYFRDMWHLKPRRTHFTTYIYHQLAQ